jgi:hypothetical protein
MEGGIQRSGFNLQQIFGRTLDVSRDRVAVHRPRQKRSQEQNVQSSLKKSDA